MKKWLLSLLVLTALSVSAQSGVDPAVALAERERERIDAERLLLEAGFDAEEAVCYKKFFVNSCLNEMKPRRRDAMAELRREEVALNDDMRKWRAADQIRRTEEKSSAEVLQNAAERRAKALEDASAREDRSRAKLEERVTLKQNEASSAADVANKAKGSQERAKGRVDKQSASAEEVKKYNDKQQEVAERKASREQRLSEQKKPASKPLPSTR